MRPVSSSEKIGFMSRRLPSHPFTRDTRPDRTILLDLPVEAAEGRAATRKPGRAWDRFEAEARAFHERVAEGYRRLAAAEPDRFAVIRADRDIDAVAADVWRAVGRLLPATTLTPP